MPDETLPDYDDLMQPLIDALRAAGGQASNAGGQASNADLAAAIAANLGLAPALATQRHQPGSKLTELEYHNTHIGTTIHHG